MCAGSKSKILDKEVSIYMGYFPGNIKIGDKTYTASKDSDVTSEEIIEILSDYSSKDLAKLIVDLIDNADE